eukprot:PhF_6_TR8688/c0_g1_i2/m.13613
MIHSVSTMATSECAAEFHLFHDALRHHHPHLPLFVASTSSLQSIGPQHPHTHYECILDRYGTISRSKMERTPGIRYRTAHEDFMMEKATIMEHALGSCSNTLFLDCDVVVMDTLPEPPAGATLGVSSHDIRSQDEALFGKYNGGWLFTSDSALPSRWREHVHTSRYYDQAAIEDLVNDYHTATWHAPPQCNFGYWRLMQSKNVELTLKRFSIQHNNPHMVTYDQKPLQSIHTHLCMPQLLGNHGKIFNTLLLRWMTRCSPRYHMILKHCVY